MKTAIRLTGLALATIVSFAAQAETHVVTISRSSQFTPARLQIRAGDTVQWINESTGTHTVTADPAKARNPEASVLLPEGAPTFDSGRLRPGAKFEQTFTVEGDYRYF